MEYPRHTDIKTTNQSFRRKITLGTTLGRAIVGFGAIITGGCAVAPGYEVWTRGAATAIVKNIGNQGTSGDPCRTIRDNPGNYTRYPYDLKICGVDLSNLSTPTLVEPESPNDLTVLFHGQDCRPSGRAFMDWTCELANVNSLPTVIEPVGPGNFSNTIVELGFREPNPTQPSETHWGVDFYNGGGPNGYIVAPTDAVVVFAGVVGNLENLGIGNTVVICMPDGHCMAMGHMEAQSIVPVGERVSKGQLLGKIGTTGYMPVNPKLNGREPHVHVEYWAGGVDSVNEWLEKRSTNPSEFLLNVLDYLGQRP